MRAGFAVVLVATSTIGFAQSRGELGTPPVLLGQDTLQPQPLAPLAPAVAAATAISVDPADRYQVSLLYRTYYAVEDNVTNGWSGSVTPCNAGATAPGYQNASIERVNVFRALAGLPGNIAEFGAVTQQGDDQNAALIMVANKKLNHQPPNNWLCWTQAGYDGASSSNLTLGFNFNYNGPTAIAGYMDDGGSNNSFVGHRRWILYPPQLNMAAGDVDAVTATSFYSANALWVTGPFGSRPATPQGTPWPSRGYLPWQLLPIGSNRWSFSFPGAVFSSAGVTMTRNGVPLSVTITENGAHDNLGYADNTLVWQPSGVTYSQPTLDVVYAITITGLSGGGVPGTVSYTVSVIDPYDAVFADAFD